MQTAAFRPESRRFLRLPVREGNFYSPANGFASKREFRLAFHLTRFVIRGAEGTMTCLFLAHKAALSSSMQVR